MITIWTNIEDLLNQGLTIEQIIQLTGYSVADVRKVECNWRNQIKTKGEANHD